MDIREVVFRVAALKPRDRPREWFPHVAVAGRSNVGKSSLINWMFKRTVARVAKAPGRTRTLNFFLVNNRFFLVDLPGYGYAKVSRSMREQWGRELNAYISSEPRLAGVVTLVDIRHGPTALDLDLQQLLKDCRQTPLVVLTKADKIGRSQRNQMQHKVKKQLDLATLPPAVSVRTGEGRQELLGAIGKIVNEWTPPEHQG